MQQLQDIPASLIRTDGGISYQLKLDRKQIKSLAVIIQLGFKIPPVICFYDGIDYWLADGIDILQATKLAEHDSVLAEVRFGELQVVTYLVNATKQPLRNQRSNGDKNEIVNNFLRCLDLTNERKNWSQMAIGYLCGVRQSYVHTLIKKVGYSNPSIVYLENRSLDVTNIGMHKKLSFEEVEFNWEAINPKQFEEIIYYIVRAKYTDIHNNIELRASPGDKGRDVEAKIIEKDRSGEEREKIYFFEAKHRKQGIGIEQISVALNWALSKTPYCLVIATALSRLTPQCRDYIKDEWKGKDYGVKVIFWEKEKIQELILSYKSTANLAVKLNLIPKFMLKLVPPSG